MLHRNTGLAVTILAGLLLAMPSLAHATAAAKNPNSVSTTVQLLSETSLHGTTLKPGTYKLVADETNVTLEQDGKMIAESKMHWKDGAKKSPYSTVVFDDHGIREIHFDGKTRYIEIAD